MKACRDLFCFSFVWVLGRRACSPNRWATTARWATATGGPWNLGAVGWDGLEHSSLSSTDIQQQCVHSAGRHC